MSKRKPHPSNVSGDFYVEYDCCTACGVPELIAPELFSYAVTENKYHPGKEVHHCYIRKQPTSNEETRKMMRVLKTQEIDCIRYCGDDSKIKKELIEANLSYLLDDHG